MAGSEINRKAVAKYHREKVDEIKVRVPKGKKEYYSAAAAAVGESLNQFAVNAMDQRISRELKDAQGDLPEADSNAQKG